MAKDVATATETDVAVSIETNIEGLAGINSMEDALAFLQETGVEVQRFGTGFYPLDKDSLVGVPFVILTAKTVNGDYGEMSVAHVVTGKPVKDQDGNDVTKGLLIDGGTGVHSQLQNYIQVGKSTGLAVPKGLVKSEYDNEHGHGVTFYLA